VLGGRDAYAREGAAIFGAPLPLPAPALAAVRAALDMAEMIELLNVERAAAAKAPIRIGIGIASGETIAGYTGTQQRATYTCIGDAVNVAARLEAHTKVADRGILIDDATREALAERVALEPMGAVPFKGKVAAPVVFAVTPPARPRDTDLPPVCSGQRRRRGVPAPGRRPTGDGRRPSGTGTRARPGFRRRRACPTAGSG
jgi:class 3 adenylate cyclase